MQKYKISTAILLDTRRAIADDTYPVKLRLNYKGKRQYYNIGYFMTEDDFTKTLEGKGKYKGNHLKFAEIEAEAVAVIEALAVFTFDGFKKKFFDDTDATDLFSLLKQRIKKMEAAGRPGTASSLQSTLKSWQGFHKHDSLPFQEITVKKLSDYEQYMRDLKKKDGTICLYQRHIKTMFREAIKSGLVREELYPFGRGMYEIPEGENYKRALPKADILKICRYKALPGSPEEYHRDLWMFSYLANGMNLADIARLKYENIIGGRIVFARKKTGRKRKKPIIIEVTPEIRAIIDRWGSKPTLPDTYIYSILKKGYTPAQELAAVKQATKMVNRYIGRVAKSVGIEGTVTSYSARHSFASVLKLSGESVSFISEALGHQNLATTENYLSSFNSQQRLRAQKKLL